MKLKLNSAQIVNILREFFGSLKKIGCRMNVLNIVSCLFLGIYTYECTTYICNYKVIMKYFAIILDGLWYIC